MKLDDLSIVTLIAMEAATIGGRIVLLYHGADDEKLQTTFKADAGMTPVTIADRESGREIRNCIRKLFPEDSLNEEESGFHAGSNRTWHIDPLDGTSSFARGQRYSTIGVAVYENGQPLAAAICHPFERELLGAESGKGAFFFSLDKDLVPTAAKPSRITIPESKPLEKSMIYLDALFNEKTAIKSILINSLVYEGKNVGLRMTGSNIDQQRQVAMGRGDITITDAVGGFYDLAAGALIIKEAGGEFCDLGGNPVNEKTQVAIGGVKSLVNAILPYLKNLYRDYDGFR